MRRVLQAMGMAVSIDIPDCNDEMVFRRVFNRLRNIDERFSTYKVGSEVSRFGRGELSEAELSKELSFVIKECRKAEEQTSGYFSAWASGAFDPSGYVKGWAVAQVGKMIEALGHHTYCIAAGGDISARSQTDKVWNIGIQNPHNKSKILNKLSISNGAVATSGSYERGFHIFNPKARKPADKFISVTIYGRDIIMADLLATAIFASGRKNPAFLRRFRGYKIVALV